MVHCIHWLQEKIEKVTFCKDFVHCLQPIYIMLQFGTVSYLMITDTVDLD